MEATQSTEIVTEIPVREIDLNDIAPAVRGETLEEFLRRCADDMHVNKLALIPSAADVFQALPVYEEALSTRNAGMLLTGRKDCVYIISADS